jgi:ribonuclease HI
MSYDRQHAKKIIKHIINDMAALLQAGTPIHELPQDRKKEIVKGWVDFAEKVIEARVTGEADSYLKAYFDGSATPNPGPMSYGFTIKDSLGHVVLEERKNLDHGTNNQAEYHGLIALLTAIKYRSKLYRKTPIRIHGDSQLVVNQVKGEWKVKDKILKDLCQQARSLLENLELCELVWVPRGQNTDADRLSKRT